MANTDKKIKINLFGLLRFEGEGLKFNQFCILIVVLVISCLILLLAFYALNVVVTPFMSTLIFKEDIIELTRAP